ncbi:hypothetical protein V1264_004581 [Littorina saxatilis]|uniref:Alpha-macroglobulin receptor-binding domain-containing protein n=2 Tax=Littorina saxatilis TaxID=31220 RepID=A0AAN9B2D5_9CAEN
MKWCPKKSDFGDAARVECPEGQAVLYYSSLDSEGDCSVVKMKMSRGVVAKSKPTPVRVYDYYNPDDEYTTSYSLQQYSVCDLEPDYMDCPYVL